MLGTKNTKKKILVIIISRNQCNKHHTRDSQILTQAIVFPAESTRPIYSGLFYCYCDIWHCGPYCTVPYIVPCLHCATFQRHTVMHKRLKLRGPYFFAKCHLFYQYGCILKVFLITLGDSKKKRDL